MTATRTNWLPLAVLFLSALCASLCTSACSDDGGDATADAVGQSDGQPGDAAATDDGGPGDSTADDGLVALDCPGGPGCVCASNADCDNALCNDTPQGRRCAVPCVDACSDGYACTQVAGPGGDAVSVCVPIFLRLCDPCAAHADCKAVGAATSSCLDHGPAGNFCGVGCASAADCPGGYDCQVRASVTGEKGSYCVPVDADNSDGVCSCSPAAVAAKLATSCALPSKGADGEVIGWCLGGRSCGAAGLGACLAPDPEAESCDGVDNDCNGQTDEGTCNDGNACTADACEPGAGGCSHAPSGEGLPCDDGDLCSQGDSCGAGVCKGAPLDCGDGNPCTLDTCDAALGCKHADANGLPCSDDNPCTTGDLCADGGCISGKSKVCKSIALCVAAQCDQDTGDCIFPAKAEGLVCDDGDVCSTGDICSKGTCVGASVDCDDGQPCTLDTCDAATGCSSAAQVGPCDDGSACTVGDTCSGGDCKAGVAKGCDDANVCTLDGCDSASGCVHQPAEGSCDDGDACTGTASGDICKAGLCSAGVAKECDDGEPCTQDGCDPKTGVCAASATAQDGATCVGIGGGPCVASWICQAGTCVANKEKSCDDGQPCTFDTCNDETGACSHAAAPDEAVCGVGDWCQQGKCVKGPGCGDGVINQEKEECDDGGNKNGDGCSATCKKQGPAPKQKLLLAATFAMGCNPKEQPSCVDNADENPPHDVTLSPYWIDLHEVEVADYRACVEADKCTLPTLQWPVTTANYDQPGRDDHPVNFVSWMQAVAYCDWAGGSRLCTEAEWEYAARGTDARTWPWGNTEPQCKHARFSGCGAATVAVGTLLDGESPFGLRDMAGNVWEFVSDVYAADYYSKSPKKDPHGPAAGSDPNSALRGLRGGGYDGTTVDIRTSRRAKAKMTEGLYHAGIRCCRSVE